MLVVQLRTNEALMRADAGAEVIACRTNQYCRKFIHIPCVDGVWRLQVNFATFFSS